MWIAKENRVLMPVELHERLSEFSYGYGVTREAELALASVGIRAVPFLPSLLHEARLGFDVAFNRPGVPLLLQFKLGQAMQRFKPAPGPTALHRPYWRFSVHTAEPEGQYELLLRAEDDGAETYYVAPKFHDWEAYLSAYESGDVLSGSLLVKPSEIRSTLVANGVADGAHRVVYDYTGTWLCSDPLPLEASSASSIGQQTLARIKDSRVPLKKSIERVFAGFGQRAEIRRGDQATVSDDGERRIYAIPADSGNQARLRAARFTQFQQRAASHEDAVAAAIGAEAWAMGAQLVLAVMEK